MPDGSQQDRLLRITPDDPYAPLAGRLPQITPAKIDEYVDAFNAAGKRPEPGFADAAQTLLRLSLTTPGAGRLLFSLWSLGLSQTWMSASDGISQAAHEIIRLMGSLPQINGLPRFDARVKVVFRAGVLRSYIFIPSRRVYTEAGTDYESIAYRVFVQDGSSSTITEKTPIELPVSGGNIYYLCDAAAYGGFQPSFVAEVPGDVIYAVAVASDGLHSIVSRDGATTWTDLGVIGGASIGDSAAISALPFNWEFGFSFHYIVSGGSGSTSVRRGNFTQSNNSYSLIDTGPAGLNPNASINSPGQVVAAFGLGGRGATSANNGSVESSWIWAFPWSGGSGYGVTYQSRNDAIVDETIAPATGLVPAGITFRGEYIIASFFHPVLRTGKIAFIHAEDQSLEGNLDWPFTVPAGSTYRGSVAAYDDFVVMPYIREVAGEIETGLVFGTVDRENAPINGAAKVSWTFVSMDSALSSWIAMTISQFHGFLSLIDPAPSSGDYSTRPLYDLYDQDFATGDRTRPGSSDGHIIVWGVADTPRFLARVHPLSSYPGGGVDVINTNVRAADDGSFFDTFDVVATPPDANSHYLLDVQGADENNFVMDRAHVRINALPATQAPLNDFRSVDYHTQGPGDSFEDSDTADDDWIWLSPAGRAPAAVDALAGTTLFPTAQSPLVYETGRPNGSSYTIRENTNNYAFRYQEFTEFGTHKHNFFVNFQPRADNSGGDFPTYSKGGNWISGPPGRQIEFTFRVTRAVFQAGFVGPLTVNLVLLNIDTQAIIHSFGSKVYPAGSTGTDLATIGGTFTWTADPLPASWAMGYLITANWNPASTSTWDIHYAPINHQVVANPTGEVALP